MKRIKKLLLTFFSIIFVVSAGLCVVACNDSNENRTPVSVTKLSPKFVYIIGDSVHMFDHFKYESGLTYTFMVAHESEDLETVEGSSYYLSKEGEYTISCTVTDGEQTDTGEETIFVGNEKAFMQFRNRESQVDWMRSMWDTDILALADPVTIVDCEYEIYIESVTIYDALDGSGRTVKIEEGVKIEDEYGTFYNGADRFTFVYECDYLFVVVCETSGGKVFNEFKIKAKENFDNLEILSGYSLNYDKTTYLASWDNVDGASKYYVKVDRKQTTITGTSIVIENMLVSEFQYFDLYVVPLDESGNRMGKLVYEDVVIAPEGSDGLVKGLGAMVNAETKEVTLTGKQVATAGYATGMRYVKNSYVAFGYKYGIGTYIDFEFTGNNLPQLCFFANEINENMTCDTGLSHLTEPNEGYLIMNGLAVNSKTNVRGADALICVGPYRFGCDVQDGDGKYIHGKQGSNRPHKNYISVAEDSKAFTASSNSLFTYNGLKEAGADKCYKYTVGTFVSGDKLAFDFILRDAKTDKVLETARFVTDSMASDIKPGHIIVYAGVKGDGVDTSFTYGLPYEGEPYPESGVTRPNENDDYYVILEGVKVASAGWKTGVGKTANSHIGIKGEYGVGTCIDFIFIGNNLPQVVLFANKIDGNMTAGVSLSETGMEDKANTGFILMNGLYADDAGSSAFKETSSVIGENRLICVGPYKLGNNNYVAASEETIKYIVSEDTLFTQQKLREDNSGRTYKYTVGSRLKDGIVEIVALLYDNNTNELLAKGTYSTGMTEEAIEALGSNIIIYGAVKGEDNDTVFKYTEPYAGDLDDVPDGMMASGETFNLDGTVTLEGVRPVHAGFASGVGPTGTMSSYIAFEGEYDVGTYIEVEFTGNNMPYVMFFADSINGYFGSNGTTDKGVVLTNGIVTYGNGSNVETNIRTDRLQIWGPYRYKGNAIGEAQNYPDELLATITSCTALTQDGLNSDTYKNTKFRYTAGTYSNGTNVGIHIILTDLDTDTVLYNEKIITTLTESDCVAGHIVLFASAKGLGNNTTFAYSVPYTQD